MNKKRLLKIANHLSSNNLAHKSFDFSKYNGGEMNPENNCGTHGCAIGELPVIFPNTFFHIKHEIPSLTEKKNDSAYGRQKKIIDFLDLSWEEYDILFVPSESIKSFIPNFNNKYNTDLQILTDVATPEEVANNIHKFILAKEDYNE